MSQFTSELAELVDRFCEGDITPTQAARLEALVSECPDARKYLLDCFQIHCELAWEFGRESEDLSQASTGEVIPAHDRRARPRKRQRVWVFAAAAVALLVAAGLGLTTLFHFGVHKNETHLPGIARIEQANDVRWCDEAVPAAGASLPAGSKLAFQQGLLAVVFQSGARVILQGPAEIELSSPSALFLQHGKLTAEVSTAAHGFTVRTPNSTVVDLGTRFGVACQAGQTDVEVFVGRVLLRLDDQQSGGSPRELPLSANSAMRINGIPGQGRLKTEPLVAGSRNFVQSLAGSAAQLQALAENDPHLVHLYSFEGATATEKLRDRRGNLDLHDVAMRDGDGGGRLEFTRGGADQSTQVVATYRAAALGGTHGRSLQSQSVFQPPASMTIELLLYLSRVEKNPEGFIACAVAARHDRDHCGFLVTAIRDGELAFLLDGGAAWLQSGFNFAPGRWYYVATTFQVNGGDTEVNAFAADLAEKSPKLSWIVRNRRVPGVPASGMLGIGNGFDGQAASVYPWPGQLGNVSIYDTVLDQPTLEGHLRALSPQASNRSELAPAKN